MASGLLRAELNSSLSLPNELALLIIDQIALADDKPLLCALARSCRGLQHLAEERLYQCIDLVSVKSLQAIISAFASRPARVRAVQTLRILYQYKPSDLNKSEESRTSFNDCVARMVNLREWHIESPYDNFHWESSGGDVWVDRDMESFRRALEMACIEGPGDAERIASDRRLEKSMERTVGLALLQNLTIHSHGATADFWDLGGFHCLFRHPALRTLHVSCISFPATEIPELASHIGKSPLTTLVFDECELTPKSLLSVLRTPARLKHLTLGENVFNTGRTRGVDPVLSKNAGASFEALAAVAHSLESLTHLDPAWRTERSPHVLQSMRPAGTGMRNFHSLKYLECDTMSFLHQAAIMNRDLAPPSLETLRLRRHWEVIIDFMGGPPGVDHYIALPSLRTLELMQASYLWHDLSRADYICDIEVLCDRHEKAYALYKAGINLKVLIEMHRDPQLIPPYLHGERVPIIECLYNASEVGFHRHVKGDWLEAPHSSSTHPSEIEQSTAQNTSNNGPPPETNQLDNTDIQRIHSETRRLLDALKRKFVSRLPRHDPYWDESIPDDDEWEFFAAGEELEVDDLNEDEDMELEMELDDDEDVGWEAEQGVQVYEVDGELFFEVYDDETDSEDEEGDEDEDDEMYDDDEMEEGGAGDGPPSAGTTASTGAALAGPVVEDMD